METVAQQSEKLHGSSRKTHGSKAAYSDNDNEQLIKKYPLGTMVEIVDWNGQWFYAMGINRITPTFESGEKLNEWVEANQVELICSICLTISTVLINEKNKQNG